MKIKTLKLFCAASISLILAACGGGEGSALDDKTEIINRSSTTNSSAASSAIGSDTLSAIEFNTANPEKLTLKGTGGTESSLVSFKVVGKTGLPISGIRVNFVLNSAVGGLALSQSFSISDSSGLVSTSVLAGTVATGVRVTASAASDPTIFTQSTLLAVATGLPDQKSMSIAAEHFNPAGWNYNDIPVNISVLLADSYNNPVADDTAVTFTTEGGSIESTCTTKGGGCSAIWKSQSPRPGRTNLTDISPNRILCLNVPDQQACEAERAGRITVLATAIGNESFKDYDATGIYDSKDTFTTEVGGNCTPNVPLSSHEYPNSTATCDDLGEAYRDDNESGTYDANEYFLNFFTDKTFDLADDNFTRNNGIYNGAFCQPADEVNKLCSRTSVSIRKDLVLVMSCDSPYLVDGALPRISTTPSAFALADCNGNSLPVGTKITVGTAEAVTLGSATNWKVIWANAGISVKLEIPVGEGSNSTNKIITVVTGS